MKNPSAPALIAAGLALTAALAWLVTRVWMGLSFSDEMLYYGQISGLVRTGRLFQDDLGVQQLAYLLVYPLFKLHAAVFPDQSYLVLYGRICLLAAYLVVGVVFWRAAGRIAGGFTTAQKLTALGAYFAWVPFQIFAFSYNTISCLLTVVLLAGWLTRDPARPRRYVVTTAILLTVLTYTYPTVGLLLIPLVVLEAGWRLGRRAALELTGGTALLGFLVLAVIAVMQGRDFADDVSAAVRYTRGFNVARTILVPDQLAGFSLLLAGAAALVARGLTGRPFAHPLGPASPPALRWTALVVLVVGAAALLGLALNWKGGFAPACAFMGLLVVAGGSLGPASPTPTTRRPDPAALFRLALLLTLAGGTLTLLVTGLAWSTGYFAAAVILLLFTLLAATGAAGGAVTSLAVAGAVMGAIVSFTSSNGVHNFGIGAAAVIPFLMLFGGRALASLPGSRGRLGGLALPALTGLLVWNGVLNPYTEQPFGREFHRIEGVPAFRGIRTSPEKVEAIARFQALLAPVELQDRRVLVLGPHPWLYFVAGGQTATPMFWMLFIGAEESYEVVAARLFRGGPPDAIIMAENTLPPPIAAKVMEWMQEPYLVERALLPPGFNLRYGRQTGVQFIPEVFLLSRPHPPSASP